MIIGMMTYFVLLVFIWAAEPCPPKPKPRYRDPVITLEVQGIKRHTL